MNPDSTNKSAYYHLFTEEFLNSRSESKLDKYTRLNKKRSERWFKKLQLTEPVKAYFSHLAEEENWIIITEPWCGDAAHILPVIDTIAQLSVKIHVNYVLRDNNHSYMNQFLTNGSMSIPIIAVYNANKELLFSWGPRPKELQQKFIEMKANGITKDEISLFLQSWYNKDQGKTIQAEFLSAHRNATKLL